MRLTNEFMENKISEGKQAKARDDSVQGFYAIFNGYGQADFAMRYQSKATSKDVVFKFGRFGKGLGCISIAEARIKAKGYRVDINQGRDLRKEVKADLKVKIEHERKIEHDEKFNQDSLTMLVDAYIREAKMELRISTIKQKRRALNHLTDAFPRTTIDELLPIDILELLNAVALKHSKSTALQVIQHGGAFWAWCLENLKTRLNNPFTNMRKRKKLYRSQAKTRVLSDDELHELSATIMPQLTMTQQRALMVMLYTGCRSGMATSAPDAVGDITYFDWREIDFERSEWSLDSRRMKAHNAVIIPIIPQLSGLLHEWWEQDDKPEYGAIAYSRDGKLKSIISNAMSQAFKRAGCDYTPHDIRRTVSTRLQRMGCPPDVRQAVRSHVNKGDIATVYETDNLFDQRMEWLTKWALELDKFGFDGMASKLRASRLGISVLQ